MAKRAQTEVLLFLDLGVFCCPSFIYLKAEGNRSELRGCLCSFAGLAGRKAEGSQQQWKAQEFPLTQMKRGLRSPAYCTG